MVITKLLFGNINIILETLHKEADFLYSVHQSMLFRGTFIFHSLVEGNNGKYTKFKYL